MTRRRIDVDAGPVKRMVDRYHEGKSIREIAAAFQVSDKAVRTRLHAAGVVMRANVKRSRLRRLNQARLFSDIVLFGVDETARRWKIPERTLKHYLSGLRKAARGE